MKKFTNIGIMSIKSYKFPITAISSIGHRVTGVIMLIAMPFVVAALACSISSEQGYLHVSTMLTSGVCSFFFWLFLSAVTYHVYAGVRHMIMDMGFGESMSVAKMTSILVLVLGVLSAVLWGAYLWL